MILTTILLAGCSRAPTETSVADAVEAYAAAHTNTLPATWEELAAWSTEKGGSFKTEAARQLTAYVFRSRTWIDSTADAPPYVVLSDGHIDAFAAALNHDLHLFLASKMIEVVTPH